jgi:hypothetical protein
VTGLGALPFSRRTKPLLSASSRPHIAACEPTVAHHKYPAVQGIVAALLNFSRRLATCIPDKAKRLLFDTPSAEFVPKAIPRRGQLKRLGSLPGGRQWVIGWAAAGHAARQQGVASGCGI